MSGDGLFSEVIVALSRALASHQGRIAHIKQREIYRQSSNPRHLRKHAATVSKILEKLVEVEDAAGRVWVLTGVTRTDVKNYIFTLLSTAREG